MAGITAGLVVTKYNPSIPEYYILVAGIASLVPDIDTPYSSISRRTSSVVSSIINMVFGHRGLFHSLLVLTGLSIITYFLLGKIFAIMFFTGYLSHLLLDALTPAGVKFLYPLPFKTGIPLVRTGGMLENIITISLVLCLLYLGLNFKI